MSGRITKKKNLRGHTNAESRANNQSIMRSVDGLLLLVVLLILLAVIKRITFHTWKKCK